VNLALNLTYLRIALIPLFVVCFYIHNIFGYLATIGAFVIASITDWLDGYCARNLHLTSKFGAFLDPVADKLLVVTALVLVANETTMFFTIIPVLLIICREILVSALREWMAQVGQAAAVKVSFGGKIKTTIQLTAIIVLLCSRNGYWFDYLWIKVVGIILLYFAAGLSLWTLYQYVKVSVVSCRKCL